MGSQRGQGSGDDAATFAEGLGFLDGRLEGGPLNGAAVRQSTPPRRVLAFVDPTGPPPPDSTEAVYELTSTIPLRYAYNPERGGRPSF